MFTIERGNLNQEQDRNVIQENIVWEILRSKKNSLTVFSTIVKIPKELLKEESREEQKHKYVKTNPPRDVIPKWWSCGA